MKTIITTIIIAAIGYGMFTLVNFGYDKSMTAHCITLQEQAEENIENPHYYVRAFEQDECREVYNIEINAPTQPYGETNL